MNENRFFTWVWRFNGLVLALLATLLLLVLTWEFTRELRRGLFVRNVTQVLPLPEETQPQTTTTRETHFGAPITPAAGGVYALPLYVEQTYDAGAFSKDSGSNRINVLVVSAQTGVQSWLFDDTARLITEIRPLRFRQDADNSRFVGTLLHVIDSDTSGDGHLSRSDAGQLFFVPPDWSGALPLEGALRSVLSDRVTNATTLEVITQLDGQTMLRRYGLPDARQVSEMTLAAEP